MQNAPQKSVYQADFCGATVPVVASNGVNAGYSMFSRRDISNSCCWWATATRSRVSSLCS